MGSGGLCAMPILQSSSVYSGVYTGMGGDCMRIDIDVPRSLVHPAWYLSDVILQDVRLRKINIFLLAVYPTDRGICIKVCTQPERIARHHIRLVSHDDLVTRWTDISRSLIEEIARENM